MAVPNTFVGKRIGNDRIELASIIGEGSYGCVYRGAILHSDGPQKTCAVKCLAKAKLDAYHLMCQRREILLHKQVSDGENVVTLYEAFEDSDYHWMVMEYSSDGDLWEKISEGYFAGRDDRIRHIFGQILDAVDYCHSKHVFHRDLKPENVLLTDGGRKVLLADFGLASSSPISNEMQCGSPWYMSPECWGGVYGTNMGYATGPNDVWCLGILLINMACGRHTPWRHAHPQDPLFRDFALDLLIRVLALTPFTRISIHDFRAEVSRIKNFTVPVQKRANLYDTQRAAWSTIFGPTLSRPQSTDMVRGSVASPSSQPGEEGVDITDAAKYDFEAKSPACKASRSFIRRIPVIDTRPQALRPAAGTAYGTSSESWDSSSSASANSLWPVTPQVEVVTHEVEVVDIPDIPDTDMVLRPSSVLVAVTKASVLPIIIPFQNILRAIGAL